MSVLAALCLAMAVRCGWRRPARRRVQARLTPPPPPATRPRSRVSQRVLRRRRSETAELVAAVAAELAAGAPWDSALRGAAEGGPLGAELGQAAQPLAALPRLATAPGAEGLGALVAVAELSQQTGAAAAGLVSRVAEVLRAEDRARRAVDVELASALATARLLAALPAVGLLMGGAVGAHPVRALLGTDVGRVCLLLALGLETAGVLWCRRIRRVAAT